jgi:SAM-dependent methyltransferase
MSRWDDSVTETAEDAKRFWSSASLDTLHQMMAPRWAWEAWLQAALGGITEPGRVFEPGCGIGLLTEFLPAGCTYYGCDVNRDYVAEAVRARSRPGVVFEHRDLDDVLAAGQQFDWVVVTSLFGMFPESATYELIERLWAAANKGMSITTVNKRLFGTHPRLRFEFTSHDPDELLSLAASLPEARRVVLRHGREYEQFRGHYWQRGLVLHAWRDPASDRRPQLLPSLGRRG